MSIPLSLYIHWPWCVKKCPYCDFNSYAINRSGTAEPDYVKAILKSLKEQLTWVQDRKIHSIFIGGGTPSLISEKGIGDVLKGISQILSFEDNVEITMEANPGTLDTWRFRSYKEAGVNRLSIGIQSFNDKFLKRLGRIHDSREAVKTAETAAELFENFNLDLMFGLPGQNISDVKEDCLKALSFDPLHLSYYQLTIEPNTYFSKFPPEGIAEEDELYSMANLIECLTGDRGFTHYEVSAYAKEGFQCRHNLNYWRYGDYLAVGPGAHGKVTLADGHTIRFENLKNPALWLETISQGKSPLTHRRVVSEEEKPFEFMLDALRLKDGVSKELWVERTGLALSTIMPIWDQLQNKKLVQPIKENLCTTDKGWRFLNEVLMEFLP